MSFVITLYVREGIVMASDSRLTLNAKKKGTDGEVVQLAVGQSDSNYKTFTTAQHVGISTFGEAEIEGVPIAGYVESFINDVAERSVLDVDAVAEEILEYFSGFAAKPKVAFHVAGYVEAGEGLEQRVWSVDVGREKKNLLNPSQKQGASWGGEGDIVTRLIQPVGQIGKDKNVSALPYHQIPWQFLTLQDAIDFSIFAVRSTIDALRFQPRPKTVGGPIDVLAIKPKGAFWVQRKELRVR